MPLVKGGSRKAIGKNIATEEAHGKSHAQAVAIALDVARRHGANIPKKGKRPHGSGPFTDADLMQGYKRFEC